MNTTIWRWFPVGLIAAIGLVFLVNGFMVYTALISFPGTAGPDGFDLSNGYKRVLQAAAEQLSLGWQIETEMSTGRRPVLRLTDRTGAPLNPDAIEARAERPVGPAETTELVFRPVGDGRFQSEQALFSGQWDMMIMVRVGSRRDSTARRLIIQ